ncbi:MAG: L-histidine N(alpha)-methyltransferase [Deltaproteobacteria bacterium]|nr:L-histidine N(alpha)-methyltransferase [Deltaproteobacteria bacterium]
MAKTQLVENQVHARLVLHRQEDTDQHLDFLRDVLEGLSRKPKAIPPKFFYDQPGSLLFERITRLKEYYISRTEGAILKTHVRDILAMCPGEVTLVEFGSGSSAKTRMILDHLTDRQPALEYIPIDISPTVIHENSHRLLEDYPNLHIYGLVCDYHHAMEALKRKPAPSRLFIFLGSSIGNFLTDEAIAFLRMVREAMGVNDRLLLGTDMVKDPAVLEQAYNDKSGVTGAFNLNLLERINRELGGGFDLNRFSHRAVYNTEQNRIEMYLVSSMAQIVPVDSLGRAFRFSTGEMLHTENSHKYTTDSLGWLVAESGLRTVQGWQDPKGYFSLTLLAPA